MGTSTKGPSVTQIKRGLADTQTKSTEGRRASSVVCQSDKKLERGARCDPPSGVQMPGKGGAHSNTRNASTVQSQAKGRERAAG